MGHKGGPSAHKPWCKSKWDIRGGPFAHKPWCTSKWDMHCKGGPFTKKTWCMSIGFSLLILYHSLQGHSNGQVFSELFTSAGNTTSLILNKHQLLMVNCIAWLFTHTLTHMPMPVQTAYYEQNVSSLYLLIELAFGHGRPGAKDSRQTGKSVQFQVCVCVSSLILKIRKLQKWPMYMYMYVKGSSD